MLWRVKIPSILLWTNFIAHCSWVCTFIVSGWLFCSVFLDHACDKQVILNSCMLKPECHASMIYPSHLHLLRIILAIYLHINKSWKECFRHSGMFSVKRAIFFFFKIQQNKLPICAHQTCITLFRKEFA